MHTAWKARCKVKEAFPAIYNSLNNEIELLVATAIVHRTVWGGGRGGGSYSLWDPSIAPTMFGRSETS